MANTFIYCRKSNAEQRHYSIYCSYFFRCQTRRDLEPSLIRVYNPESIRDTILKNENCEEIRDWEKKNVQPLKLTNDSRYSPRVLIAFSDNGSIRLDPRGARHQPAVRCRINRWRLAWYDRRLIELEENTGEYIRGERKTKKIQEIKKKALETAYCSRRKLYERRACRSFHRAQLLRQASDYLLTGASSARIQRRILKRIKKLKNKRSRIQ